MTARHIQQGKEAEVACCRFLKSNGLELITTNYHSRYGEIDLVMQDQDTIVFVEVRYRKNNDFGGGLESVTPAKIQKLKKTAELYLQQNTQYNNARFDVVSMSKTHQTSKSPSITDRLATVLTPVLNTVQAYSFDWIRNAF